MTQYESIDPDKVKEIFARSFAIDKRTGEVLKCAETPCTLCLFHGNECCEARLKWLDQPALDPEKDIDWSKVPVDTPVLVWNFEDHLYKRYFSGIKNEYFGAYRGGCTSWSETNGEIYYWCHCNLYRPEDVEKYRKKDTENGYKEGVH